MAVFILFIFIIIFYSSFLIGESLSNKHTSVAQLGQKTYLNKIKALESSAIFAPLRKTIKLNSVSKSFIFILPLILLKSIAFCLISLFLITPLILIFQGIIMGSLTNYHSKIRGDSKTLRSITFWQLLSHIIAAAIGTEIGLKWLYYKEIGLNIKLLISSGSLIFWVFIVISAVIASYLESKSLMTTDNEYIRK